MKKLKFNIKDVPYFANGTSRHVLDIIVYVRSRVQSPREAVIIDTEFSGYEEDLKNVNIYLSEDSYRKNSRLNGITAESALVIDLDDKLNYTVNDIVAEINNYMAEYKIPEFKVYITGTDFDQIYDIYKNAQEDDLASYNVQYHAGIKNKIPLKENGYDIYDFIKKVENEQKTLSWETIKDGLSEIEHKIVDEDKELQCISLSRSNTEKIITTYLGLKTGKFAELKLFLYDLATTKYIYPYEKLDMYERIRFMKKLPKAVGFSSASLDDIAMIDISIKVYPEPVFIYMYNNEGKGRILEYSKLPDKFKSLFYAGSIPMDYEFKDNSPSYIVSSRSFFKGSEEPFPKEALSNKYSFEYEDVKTDLEFVEMFSNIEDDWIEYQKELYLKDNVNSINVDQIFMSFKNSYFVKVNMGSGYTTAIVYCKDSFGVSGMIYSEVSTEGIPTLVQEENFYRFIDLKYADEMIRREYKRIIGEHALMVKENSYLTVSEYGKLEPAVEPLISLASDLMQCINNTLSYYDKILRCRPNVLPVVLDSNSKLYEVSSIFKVFSMHDLRHDEVAKRAITSCGTVGGFNSPTVLVGVDTFKGVDDLL